MTATAPLPAPHPWRRAFHRRPRLPALSRMVTRSPPAEAAPSTALSGSPLDCRLAATRQPGGHRAQAGIDSRRQRDRRRAGVSNAQRRADDPRSYASTRPSCDCRRRYAARAGRSRRLGRSLSLRRHRRRGHPRSPNRRMSAPGPGSGATSVRAAPPPPSRAGAPALTTSLDGGMDAGPGGGWRVQSVVATPF